MDAKQIIQWHEEWKLAASHARAAVTAGLDAVMAENGYERDKDDEDGGWRKIPAPRPEPAAVPRIPEPRPPADRTAA